MLWLQGQAAVLRQSMQSLRDELTTAQAVQKAQKQEIDVAIQAKLQTEASCSQITSDLQSKADKANAFAGQLQNEMALLRNELAAEQQRSCSLTLKSEALQVRLV